MATFVRTDRGAVGPKYSKLGGWIVLALYGLALWLVPPSALRGVLIAAAVAAILFASIAGWGRPAFETVALWVAVLLGGAAVVMAAVPVAVEPALDLASAFGSALVLGFATWGMILGHWYLVSQGLDIAHLRRLTTPLPWLIGAKIVISVLALWLMRDRLAHRDVLDVFNAWARIPVGLLVPLVLAFMTRVTVRMGKTQPATGILYAMCAILYMGELMGRMTQGTTGVPL